MEKELTAAVTTQEPMLADRLIVVQQLPVIKEQLHSIKAQAQASVAEALALVCTEETLKAVKDRRAALTRDRKDLDGAKAILEESRFLDHCIQRGTRYFERIAKRESYIFFMRRKADPNTPWYTLEVEPGGTVRQKRSYNNDQYADLEDAKPFIAEWQQVVQGRMTAAEIDFARQSKEIRAQEFAELKENGNIIRTGANAGKLLVDELMHDLMEVEKRVG